MLGALLAVSVGCAFVRHFLDVPDGRSALGGGDCDAYINNDTLKQSLSDVGMKWTASNTSYVILEFVLEVIV